MKLGSSGEGAKGGRKIEKARREGSGDRKREGTATDRHDERDRVTKSFN